MRSNQVSIKLARFFDKENLGIEDLEINVYADANNVYEALASAYFEVLQQLQIEGNIELPHFGRRESYPSRSFSYNKAFSNFLEKNNQLDDWRDFRKENPTLEDQFLEEKNLLEEFKTYVGESLENEQ